MGRRPALDGSGCVGPFIPYAKGTLTIFKYRHVHPSIVVELGLVWHQLCDEQISAGVATALFLLYAAINGLTFFGHFSDLQPGQHRWLRYHRRMFGGMSLIGYTTRMDLTSLRGFSSWA